MKIESLNKIQLYYHCSRDPNLGEDMEPRGLYEKANEDNTLEFDYDQDTGAVWFDTSDIEESAFSKSPEEALLGKIQSDLNIGEKINLTAVKGTYYIYSCDIKPDIDLSNTSIGDFGILEEVRYRKIVPIKKVGEIIINDSDLKYLKDIPNAYIEGNIDGDIGYRILTRAKKYLKSKI